MKQAPTKQSIGPYAVIKNLGKGGMGEVYLVQDPVCNRQVALKRIRPDLQKNQILKNRFLREAQVASLLNHPSIIPIFSIHTDPSDIYYTMPFVEGNTLRQILREAKGQKKNDLLAASIPALARVFLQVCEAIAYTHAKGILHRDIKPENIIVGKYGEVMILDWGIADFIQSDKDEELPSPTILYTKSSLTHPGKITGTLAYMAPERLKTQVSSIQTDIYALGVLLYQILTLSLPFSRRSLSAFRKHVDAEELIDPIEMAPYREIPVKLSEICKKCLSPTPHERPQDVKEILVALKNYIEGRSDWVWTTSLDLQRKQDWQLQEHILLAKNIAISKSLDVTQWAGVAISKASFTKNIFMEVEAQLDTHGQGLGFLLSVPHMKENQNLEEGYCLWIGSQKEPGCKLFRNNVEVLQVPSLYLKPGQWHHLHIEKLEDRLKFYLDKKLICTSTSYLPLAGSQVGLLHKDGDFSIRHWNIFETSHQVTVGCLEIPNTLLSHKLYDLALEEYRRIGQCLIGRTEGWEALFRAGLTLLEKARVEKGKSLKKLHFQSALKEFEKLYRTPAAPLEYLGKSFVYHALKDFEEEAKYLELALRKFPEHPKLPMLKEHIVYRMHESSLNHRESAYRILLLAIRHIPDLFDHPDTAQLIESLEKNWEQIPFIEEHVDKRSQIAIQLAFWLANVPILLEMAEQFSLNPTDEPLLHQTLFALLELEAKTKLQSFPSPLNPAALCEPIPSPLHKKTLRSLFYLLREELDNGNFSLLHQAFTQLRKHRIPKHERIHFDALEAWYYLLQNQSDEAFALFQKYPSTTFLKESSPLHFPYGTWLHIAQNAEHANHHFQALLETPHPPTSALPSYFLTNPRHACLKQIFWWERKQLSRQVQLFYRCTRKLPCTNHKSNLSPLFGVASSS